MSISLKNHEDRIKVLENKATSSESIIKEVNWSSHGYCVLKGGLIFNWGRGTFTFKKAFPNACCGISSYLLASGGEWCSDAMINSISKTGFTTLRGVSTYFIAIGYLISNRVRSLLGGGLA